MFKNSYRGYYVMKKRYCVIVILCILSASFALCSCGEKEPAVKSTFGSVDPMTDGEVLIDSKKNEQDDTEGDTDAQQGAVTVNTTMKTSKRLDLDDLPPAVSDMIGLCNAINVTCVDQHTAYSQDKPEFVWHCLHMYINSCTDKRMGIEHVAEYSEVSPQIADDIIFSMFGKLREMPQLPRESLEPGDDGIPRVAISNDLKYRFRNDDRPPAVSEVRRVTQYSDGTLEMEVALDDPDTGEEIVSFIYGMRPNTRDTTTAALFYYEITGVRSADKITSDKMEGTPFLVEKKRIYGREQSGGSEAGSNEIEEVLYYASFSDNVPGVTELNGRIDREVLEYALSPVDDTSWHEIISYPLTSYGYVQFAVTFGTYPNNGDDPDIQCYNYDKDNEKAVDPDEVFGLCQKSDSELKDAVISHYSNITHAGDVNDIVYKGFIVRRDNSFDIFYMLNITDEAGIQHNRLYIYNSTSDSLRYAFDGSGVIPEDEQDVMKPPLLHGRKDQ